MLWLIFQRFAFSEMSINQCQTGIDDNSEIPPEMFDTERVRIGRKGKFDALCKT